jgi:hypothetical protein
MESVLDLFIVTIVLDGLHIILLGIVKTLQAK